MSLTNYRRRTTGVPHGTPSGYTYHRCRCDQCREAQRITSKRRRTGQLPAAQVDATGSHRRLQALQAIGYGRKELAALLGYASPDHSSLSELGFRPQVHREFAAQVAELYEGLCMTPGPSRSVRIRARNRGCQPPLAWDGVDMDDPTAEPNVGDATSGNADDDVDEVAVARAVKGTLPAAQLRREERLTAVARLVAAEITSNEIARRLHCHRKQVDRDRTTLKTRRYRTRQDGEVAS